MVNLKLAVKDKQVAVQAAAAVIFVILGWTIAVQPVIARIKFSNDAARTAAERSKLIFDIQSLKKKLADLEKPLVSESDRHLVLGEITRIANESGINVRSLVPTSIPDVNYMKLAVELKAESSFHVLLKFLNTLEKSRPDISVAQLTATMPRGGGSWGAASPTPQISAALETYLKKK